MPPLRFTPQLWHLRPDHRDYVRRETIALRDETTQNSRRLAFMSTGHGNFILMEIKSRPGLAQTLDEAL